MDDLFARIRRQTITALFADDMLMDLLVLKGGNALSLVHGLSTRASLDIDFSIDGDFPNIDEVRRRIFRSLRDRFDSLGYVVFDEEFSPKPELDGPDIRPWWGGYQLEFKLIPKADHDKLMGNHEKMRIHAQVVGPGQRRVFSADFSKHEFTQGKLERELDSYTIYVYSPIMVAVEKLRAICQQMPEYPMRGRRRPRARDFYDIHLVVTKDDADLAAKPSLDLLTAVFATKRVPLALLGAIHEQREFHRPDWPAVVNAVGGPIQAFDHYFDFVVAQVSRIVERLKILGDI
jgi:predicted nucleotidyltransferase component of viral defense system